MINSEEFVIEVWRSSIGRFITDMWDRTPTTPGTRFLAPIDPILGFSPDNVEWQFPKVRRKYGPRTATAFLASKPSKQMKTRQTKAEKRESVQEALRLAKEAKRRAIAEEFARWERMQKSG